MKSGEWVQLNCPAGTIGNFVKISTLNKETSIHLAKVEVYSTKAAVKVESAQVCKSAKWQNIMECDKYCHKKVGISQGGHSKGASWDNHDLSYCRQGCGLKWGETRCEKSATPLNF